jgi:predicted dehydrogenase
VVDLDEIRMGLVGMGPRGRSWIRVLKLVAGVKLVALCERIGPLLERARAEAGDALQTYRDFGEMLEKTRLDAVGVVVEPHNQPDLIIRALDSGAHVCSEVPLAYTMEDCRRIVAAVERTGLKYEMAEQVRYAPYVCAWKEMIEAGQLGEILFAEGQYLHGMTEGRHWFDGETGDPLTWAQAEANPRARKARMWYMPHPILYLPHDLSPLLKATNDRVTRVACFGTMPRSSKHPEFPVPDLEVSIMKTHRNAIFRMAAGFNVPTAQPYHWLHIMGTKGSVETNRSLEDSMKIYLAEAYMVSKQNTSWQYTPYQQAPPEAGSTGHGGLDYYPLADFVRAIREDCEPEMDVYAAVETAAPAIMAAASAERGGTPLEVPDLRPRSEKHD